MATSIHLAETAAHTRPSTRRNPIVLWHLLSLDAPTVAALWTWFLARANGVHLPATCVLAMALAVWMLYAADRLLDTRSHRPEQALEERHYFHRVHSRAFTSAIFLAAFVLAALLRYLEAESVHLYLLLGAILFAYFVLIHSSATYRRLPKELAVGVFFSAATFIPTVSRQPGLRLILFPAAILFAVLCSLNCLFIYAWENPDPSPFTHPATRMARKFIPALTTAAVLSGIGLFLLDPSLPWQIAVACSLSAACLLLVHLNRKRLNRSTLRAAADLCLLTPILLLAAR